MSPKFAESKTGEVVLMGGLKSFAILIGTFVVIYFLTPLMVQVITKWLPIEHPERVQNGLAILAMIAVYAVLRKSLGGRMPPV